MFKFRQFLILPLAASALLVAGIGAASAASTPTVNLGSSTALGKFLVNGKGLTLYHNDNENLGRSDCSGDCLKIWRPLIVPKNTKPMAGTGVVDKLGVVFRKGKGDQVTYDGWPLYTFAGDDNPGDTHGQDFAGKWFVVAPQPTVNLTVNITSTGPSILWGKVTMSWTYEGKPQTDDCATASCTAAVNAGQTVTLRKLPPMPPRRRSPSGQSRCPIPRLPTPNRQDRRTRRSPCRRATPRRSGPITLPPW